MVKEHKEGTMLIALACMTVLLHILHIQSIKVNMLTWSLQCFFNFCLKQHNLTNFGKGDYFRKTKWSYICSAVWFACCFFMTGCPSLQRLGLVSDALVSGGRRELKGDRSAACMFSLNLNFQISVSCLILSASQSFYPHLLVFSNLFSLWLYSAFYLRPRQSIKVLNGGWGGYI